MNLFRALSTLMVLSAMFLAIGGLILRMENLVPVFLTFSTIGVVVAILAVAHFVNLGKHWAIHAGLILGFASIVFNLSQPSHTDAILHPVITAQFMALVVSEVLGFFLLPALYIIIYALKFRALLKND